MASGSLVFTAGGDFMPKRYEVEARRPRIQVTHATSDLVTFTMTDTDISVANALRRIMLAEVPTLAIETVNIEENETVLFDEFIAHRMGLLPLSCHSVGDIPADEKRLGGFVEHKDCNCFDGCPYCTVEFKLDVANYEDKVLNVTHFDLVPTEKWKREGISDKMQVRPVPFPNTHPSVDVEQDKKENGVIIAKLKKDQHLKMVCQARKGLPKYHGKFHPTATALFQYQPIIKLEREVVDELSLDDKIGFIESCPRKVFALDIEDKIQIEKLMDCIYCEECMAYSRDKGIERKNKDMKSMVVVTQDLNMFHFKVEGVTPDGPRSVIDVVRAAIRILDYKMSYFLQDAYDEEIEDGDWLPEQPQD